MSCADALADFVSFMEANGVVPTEPIAQRLCSGNLIRFRCEGDGKGRLNGWAILYLDERPAGAFGNYRLNTGTLKWRARDDRPPLSQAERDALQAEWREARDRREAELQSNQRQAALDAADMWKRAAPADPSHPYVTRKSLDPAPLKQEGEQIYIPMFDADGILRNLQRIRPDGEKRFLRGGRVDDLFCIHGTTEGASEAIICEGYATGDAIHKATGLPVITAFSGKNMIRIARLWNERRPDLAYTIYGDDDRATEAKTGRNPGRECAAAAATEIGARLAFPLDRRAA